MYKTASGLKYIILKPSPNTTNTNNGSTASSPRYGQLCVISYTGYMKLPKDREKQQFDSSTAYVLKHGNGRLIPGLDEGLHTMKVGEIRRIIIPPKLGFINSGLGPFPEYPWNRWKLNWMLDDMITQRGGNLIYDVELKSVFDDEADQGYYDDESPSPEELEQINRLFNGPAARVGSDPQEEE